MSYEPVWLDPRMTWLFRGANWLIAQLQRDPGPSMPESHVTSLCGRAAGRSS